MVSKNSSSIVVSIEFSPLGSIDTNNICSGFLPTKRALALFPTGTYTGIGAGQFDIKMKFAKKGRYSDPHCISNFVFNFQQFWVKQVEHL